MTASAPVTTLALESPLDASAALRIRDLLERAPGQARIVLDLGRVRDLDPFALASLVLALAGEPPGRVRLRGLCHQHARLLGYLGLDVDRLGGRAGAFDERSGAASAAAALAAGAAGPPPAAPPA